MNRVNIYRTICDECFIMMWLLCVGMLLEKHGYVRLSAIAVLPALVLFAHVATITIIDIVRSFVKRLN